MNWFLQKNDEIDLWKDVISEVRGSSKIRFGLNSMVGGMWLLRLVDCFQASYQAGININYQSFAFVGSVP